MPESKIKGIDVDNLSLLNIIELLIDKLISYAPASEQLDELVEGIYEVPTYHLLVETVLVIFIVRLIFASSYQPGEMPKVKLGQKEVDELCADWVPEPLVPESFEPSADVELIPVIETKVGEKVMIKGKERINLASANFLGMVDNAEIEKVAVAAVQKYGVGSCGPRGFYGTVDVHLTLEEKLTEFCGTEETVTYSYGFATIASAIPAYCKKMDIIFVDDGVSFPVQKGLLASNSHIKFFNHNNMGDLERLLLEQSNKDAANPRKAKVTRKFIIAEGLYPNYGDICPLDKLVALKNKYKVYLFVEESFSFGTLGKTGRGISEHFGIDIDELDMMVSSTENSLGSIGGFCTGTQYVINHQRLNSSGYVFSASLPPLLNSTAICALDILDRSPELVATLRAKAKRLHKKLSYIEGIRVVGLPLFPSEAPSPYRRKARRKGNIRKYCGRGVG